MRTQSGPFCDFFHFFRLRNSRETPEVFFRPWRDFRSFLSLFPRDKSLGYCLSPSGPGWSGRKGHRNNKWHRIGRIGKRHEPMAFVLLVPFVVEKH